MTRVAAAMINGRLTNDPNDFIRAVLAGGHEMELIDRLRLQFMAACDLGPQWTSLNSGPDWFVREDGAPPKLTEEARALCDPELFAKLVAWQAEQRAAEAKEEPKPVTVSRMGRARHSHTRRG